ncbi:unnamed protein product [Zymoseptoria tritici ST99CH_3D1]|uniref:Uncharacterized protein n=3 Tax=Zymoseptoria tritici TaxID=1047171 RepID=F9X1R3_ZYMTI|nr:uncharacterized protein MYCGRDRAFT_91042 [Zymoseptoria tritici IPO323]EGP90352.1 hypothetical protein MYCGRDRAFT_91042 [Zymoseptoria tritici IPO323]SMQ47991.1 unnamed protein product [Zymoseptoria tritici ST99CH_3D7]SMR46536.1 unnamed protein product [Zymoseptoria tritici ST99CH_1E4]SMR47779.1 unnamed protein product [Zymoseptoria tritici ST99CH_3D1]
MPVLVKLTLNPSKGKAAPSTKKIFTTSVAFASLPSFSAQLLQIYHWPWPARSPSANYRMYKEAVDAQYASGTFVESNDEHIALSDKIPSDPDADNWDDFSNVIFDNYGSVKEFHHCVAAIFVSRAKRAFRAGKSFAEFHDEELAIDTDRARALETDPGRCQLHMELNLSNDLRIAILARIQERLCQEIWLQPFDPSAVSEIRQDARWESVAGRKARGETKADEKEEMDEDREERLMRQYGLWSGVVRLQKYAEEVKAWLEDWKNHKDDDERLMRRCESLRVTAQNMRFAE